MLASPHREACTRCAELTRELETVRAARRSVRRANAERVGWIVLASLGALAFSAAAGFAFTQDGWLFGVAIVLVLLAILASFGIFGAITFACMDWNKP